MNKNKKNKNVKVNEAIDHMQFTNNIDNLKPDENKGNANNKKKTDNFID